MINLKPCPFCGESNGSLLAFGPVGATKEIRERKQATTCLSCGAEGPAVDRVDGLFGNYILESQALKSSKFGHFHP